WPPAPRGSRQIRARVESPEATMGAIVLFTSAITGTGSSTLARAFAAEAAHGLNTKMVDLDGHSGATYRWGRQREKRGILPVVPVESARPTQLRAAARSVEVLVADAPVKCVHLQGWLTPSIDDRGHAREWWRCRSHFEIPSGASDKVANVLTIGGRPLPYP